MLLFITFFATLVLAAFLIRARIDKLIMIVEKKVDDIKELVTNPTRMAATVGEAVVETAMNQVSKFTGDKKVIKRKR